MNEKKFEEAIHLYQELLSMMAKSDLIDWQPFVDNHLRCAQGLIELKKFAEAEILLSKLLKKNPPSQFRPPIARLLAQCSQSGDSTPREEALTTAWIAFREIIDQFPLEQWSAEERCFYRTLEMTLNQKYDALLKRAQLFSVAKHYEEAIAMYREVLRAIELNIYPKATCFESERLSLIERKVRMLLAETNMQKTEQEKAANENEQESQESLAKGEFLDSQLFYMSANAYLKRNDFDQAIHEFKIDVADNNREKLEEYFSAHLEIARNHYLFKEYESAQKELTSLVLLKPKNMRQVALAATLLAQICHKKNSYREMLHWVQMANLHVRKEDPLQAQLSSLEAKGLWGVYNYAKARTKFQNAILHNHDQKATLYLYLADCYMKLGDENTKCEKILMQLQKTAKKSKATLLLAKHEIQQNQTIRAKERLLQLLNQNECDPWEQQMTYLMLAELESNASHYLELATAYEFVTLPTYSKAWFAKGDLALKNQNFDEAIFCYENALDFSLLTSFQISDKEIAELALFDRLFEKKSEERKVIIESLNAKRSSCPPLAAESYFECYPIKEYFEGNQEALDHLKQFTFFFPNSLLNVAVHFLLGLHMADLQSAMSELQLALDTFGRLPNLVKSSGPIYFHYLAKLELARRTFSIDPNQSLDLLQQISGDFKSEQSYASELKKETNFHPIFQEALYLQALIHRKLGCDKKAKITLFEIIHQFALQNKTKGAFLSLAFKQQALIAHSQGQHESAQKLLTCAKEAAEGVLCKEQLDELSALQNSWEEQKK